MCNRGYLRIIRTAAVLFLAAFLAVGGSRISAHAAEDGADGTTIDEFDYSGPLDPVTNEIPDEENGTDESRVKLSGTMYYDLKSHDFVYPIQTGAGSEVHSSAADGMVTSQKVTITTKSDSDIVIYQNGELYSDKAKTISRPGEYVVSTRSGGDLSRLFSFIIIGERTNELTVFTVPDGFYMISAKRDENPISYDRFSVRMDAEGAYRIEYSLPAAEKIYTLETMIDRTPPTLEFSGKINSENQVRSELTFTGVEEGGQVAVIRDGTHITVYPDSEGKYKLDDSGVYTIRAYDAAGNMTEYNYRIMMYFNISSILFVLFAAALLIGVGVYVLIRRNSLKIG